ncbi:MAG: diacylglycerol kinase family protein [Eubacteriales bacterium]|jgi:diacylglycerol kinase|nr:diacylglycerol kinase family protein [Eubacteriales bacterium]
MLSKKLWHSFSFAFGGLWFCIKNERNFRVHTFAALTVYLISPYYGFKAEHMVLLTLVVSLVIICEMINTAIEAAVDLATEKMCYLAKKAKDVSAGAVLISAFCAVLCGLFLFLKPAVILGIIKDITASPLKIFGVLAYITLGYFYVRGFGGK